MACPASELFRKQKIGPTLDVFLGARRRRGDVEIEYFRGQEDRGAVVDLSTTKSWWCSAPKAPAVLLFMRMKALAWIIVLVILYFLATLA